MAEKIVGEAARVENPMMPDETLRRMYTAMVQMRLLEEHMAKGALKKSGGGNRIRGEEAARASTTLSLGMGDLLSDFGEAPGMDLLLGAKLDDLKRRSGERVKKAAAAEIADGSARRIAPAKDAGEQLQIAVGAGAALKAQRGGRVLLVFVRAGEAKRRRWEKTLRVAGTRELPVIFVVLPAGGKEDKDAGTLSRRSQGWGVPGFPVDGADAIAMYRVMQESLLRGRSDGGPALIECISFRPEGKGEVKVEDPVVRLGELLVAKGVADEQWIARTRAACARQIGGRGR